MNQDVGQEHQRKPSGEDAFPRDDDAPISWEQLPQLMQELARIAHSLLARESNAQSVQTTDLINSALLRRGKGETAWREVTWKNRKHFFASMNVVMRRVLIDHAKKRLHRVPTVPLDESRLAELPKLVRCDLGLAIDVQTAIDRLERLNGNGPLLAEIARYWIYPGLNSAEIARFLEKSERNIRRYRHQVELLLAQWLCGSAGRAE